MVRQIRAIALLFVLIAIGTAAGMHESELNLAAPTPALLTGPNLSH